MLNRVRLASEWQSTLESQMRKQRVQGETWYLVEKRWFEQFERFVRGEQSLDSIEAGPTAPGKIQNHGLVEGGDELERGIGFPVFPDRQPTIKPSISEGDYVAVPSVVWMWLHSWFGGGPCVPQHCVESQADNGLKDDRLTINVHLGKKHVSLHVPCNLGFDAFQAQAADALHIAIEERENYCITSEDLPNLMDQAKESNQMETLQSLGVQDNASLEFTAELEKEQNPKKSDAILLGPARKPVQFDMKIKSAHKPLAPSSSALSHRTLLSPVSSYSDRVVSAKGDFNSDLNLDNPLGKGGEMATAFGSLLQKIWRGDVDFVSPEGFKHILGKHAVQFQSYDQHDSQEFLSYLLDMLHEDLNRVKKKPYIEEGDDDGKPDEEVAKESWTAHRARNDSAIVDHFQGLLKSTLDCPHCGHHKRKFDPFMYMSVPLPGNDTILREVTVVPMDGVSKQQLYCVKVFKNDTVAAFLEAVAIVLAIKVETAQQRLQAAAVSTSNRVTVLDDINADLPHKNRWSHDKLVVYLYPEVDNKGAHAQPSKKAVIMPPGYGGKGPLPLLLRVPGNAIELEYESSSSGTSLYRPSNKRYLLRPDCELARRVEDLLKPFKRLRSGSNLVYSPVASSRGQVVEDSEMDEGADGPAGQSQGATALQGLGEGIEHDRSGALVLDRDGDCLSPHVDMDIAVHGRRQVMSGGHPVGADRAGEAASAAADAVEGVASATGAFSLQSPAMQAREAAGRTPSRLMDSCSNGSGAAGAETGTAVDSRPGQAMDTVQGVPAQETIEGTPCLPGPVNGLLGGCESEQQTSVPNAAPAPAPPAPPPPSRTGAAFASGSNCIIGDVPPPEPLDLCGNVAASPGMDSQGGVGESADEASDQSSMQPAVRLMVVTEAGYQVGYAPQPDADTRFFKLDVPSKEAVDLFDVDAMSQVERHDSMAQFDIRNEYSLKECIRAYLASEVLGPSDTWHCPKCRQDVRARKALDLWCLPEVLIIHLKRFSYLGSGYYSTMSSKIDNLVDFPLEGLDMTQFVHAGNDEEAVYDCFGVSNHFGSVSGGHYTAYCAHEGSVCADGQQSGDWNCYNDRSIASTSPSSVVTSSAYVLFYRRRSKSEEDPENLVQLCKEKLQKEYPEQADQAMGEEPASGDARCATSPSTSTEVTELRAARERLGDGLIDSNPLPAALQAALSPTRPVDESMSAGEPNTPEPNAISLDASTPITSSQSDGVPREEAEMKTFGMSTSVRMGQALHGTTEFSPQDVASDIADLSDTGDAMISGDRMQLSVHSQGGGTSEDGNDDSGRPGGSHEHVQAWLHNMKNDE